MLNAVGNSALIKHMLDYDHEFDFDNTTIVQKSISARKLNFLEMFHIQCEDSCNQRSDVKNLSLAYSLIRLEFQIFSVYFMFAF